MSDVARTVMITAEQDKFLTRVMGQRNWSRSQVVRLAVDALRASPVILLSTDTTDSLTIHEQTA